MRQSSLRVLVACALLAITAGACARGKCACATATTPSVQPADSPSESELPTEKRDVDAESELGPLSSEQALRRLLEASQMEPEWFDDGFLKAVPIPSLLQMVEKFRTQFGALIRIEPADDKFDAVYEKGVVPCSVTLDNRGRFSGLWFHPPRLTRVSLEETLGALRALPGKVSALLAVSGDREDLVALEADVPMAVGSAFKLAIAKAVAQKLKGKKNSWKTVLELEPRHRSLPSGALHLWPDRTPVTLATAMGLMISQSDNTATDLLLDWVERKKVESISPRNKPFLSTRQAFVLKSKGNEALLERYRKADVSGRLALLKEVDAAELPKVTEIIEEVTSDIEWFFTARELCALLEDVGDQPAFSINPGLVDASDFDAVAYKGGSEQGVLNFSTRVQKNGKTACVVVTWNDEKPVDAGELAAPYRGLMAVARDKMSQN